jgi:hypothetical protein
MKLSDRAQKLLKSIEEEDKLDRMIPNDAAWAIIEEASVLARAVIEESK